MFYRICHYSNQQVYYHPAATSLRNIICVSPKSFKMLLHYRPISTRCYVESTVAALGQWSNYGGARGGLAHLKDLAAPAKRLF